jgi:hypothetical protein
VEQVSRHDNFFDLGGNSIGAIRLKARLEQNFGREISIAKIFEHPVLHDLAGELKDSRWQESGRNIEAVPRDRPLPLSFVQERLWFLNQRDHDNAYNMAGALALSGPLSVRALESALIGLVERHEPFRTRFAILPGAADPYQYIDSSAQSCLEVRSTSEDQIEAIVRAHSEQTFNLTNGPVISALLIRLEPDRHVLSIVLHHIVADGWSLGVLMRDIRALYSAQLDGTLADTSVTGLRRFPVTIPRSSC